MAMTSQITIDVLRHLAVHGLSPKSDVEKLLGRIPVATLPNLAAAGYVAIDRTQKDPRFCITTKGAQKLKNPGLIGAYKPRKRRTAIELEADAGNTRARNQLRKQQQAGKAQRYEPTELKASVRPGAMYAYTLPSRMGNRLHWPDGTVTDLDHFPLQGA